VFVEKARVDLLTNTSHIQDNGARSRKLKYQLWFEEGEEEEELMRRRRRRMRRNLTFKLLLEEDKTRTYRTI